MKRDPRLHDLSRDHHHALVLARKSRSAGTGSEEEARALLTAAQTTLERDLLPHFAVEEELLLPALDAAGCADLTERTRADHARLEELLRSGGGPRERLRRFGDLLGEHVRFEERELFPAAERLLGPGVLAAVREASAALESAQRRRARHPANG